MSEPEAAKQPQCPGTEDGLHCEHWYDCEPCHVCGLQYEPDPLCDCPKCSAARGDAAQEEG